MTLQTFSKHRFAFLSLALLATLGLMFAVSSSRNAPRGSLLSLGDSFTLINAFDADHNGKLTVREMRKAVATMVREIALMAPNHGVDIYGRNHPPTDLTGDGLIDKNDLTFLITGIRSFLSAVCGNGLLEGGEQCDAGQQNGVVCDSGNAKFSCQYCSSACVLTMHTNTAACGNGVTEPGEGCDDGNTQSQDGCSSGCNMETHYACVNYACTLVAGFGPNTCGNGCLPPPNDGIRAEITVTKNPMTMYTPTTANVTIHPDRIRSEVTADLTFGFPDNGLDELTFDPRCTRVTESGNFPRLHLSCSLGTINPSTDIHIAVNFESTKCAGITSVPTGIFDIPATLLITDTMPRAADAPPLVPLTVGLPYKCTTPPYVIPGPRIDAACTAGRFGFSSNDFYIGLAHADDPIRHESHIFAQRTSFVRYFRYSDTDHTIAAETIPIEGPGFVYDARWDDVHHVVYLAHQGYDRLREQLGGLTTMCFDPATKEINGGACPTGDTDISGFPVSTMDGYRSAWKRCFLSSR